MAVAADRYRDSKSRFKARYIGDECDDPQEAMRNPPPGMDDEEWRKHVDFFFEENYVQRAITNKGNRSKKKYPSLHGTKSYASIQNKNQDQETGQYPSLISQYGSMHWKDGGYVHQEVQMNHAEMLRLRAEQDRIRREHIESGNPNPMPNLLSEQEILTQVLGERRGFNRGCGKALPRSVSVGTSSHSGTSQGRTFIQDEVETIVKTHTSLLQKEISQNKKKMSKTNKVMKSMWNFLSKRTKKHPEINLDSNEEDEENEDEED